MAVVDLALHLCEDSTEEKLQSLPKFIHPVLSPLRRGWWEVRQTGCTACPAQHMLCLLPPRRADMPGPTVVGTQSATPDFAVVLVVTSLWDTYADESA